MAAARVRLVPLPVDVDATTDVLGSQELDATSPSETTPTEQSRIFNFNSGLNQIKSNLNKKIKNPEEWATHVTERNILRILRLILGFFQHFQICFLHLKRNSNK